MSCSDWPEVALGDVAQLVRGVSYRPPDLLGPRDGGVPLLRATNIGKGALELMDVLYVPSSLVRDEQMLRRFDVVIAMSSGSRQAVGRLAQLRRDWRGCAGAFCGVIRPDSRDIHPEFLGYVLQSPLFRTRIETYAVGTAIMNLSRERLLGFKFRLPDRTTQCAIAGILGALDDRIELNRRVNRTLESIARAIFKSWFVDFDPVRMKMEGKTGGELGLPPSLAALFPDSFGGSPIGSIPGGWQTKPLDQVADFLNGLALQKYPPTGSGDLPAIKGAELTRGVADGSGKASGNLPAEYVVSNGDVLFSWSGSLQCVIWSGGRGALNQHLFKVTSRDYPKWFVFHWIQEHLATFREIAADKATTMGHIKRGHLSEAMVVVPTGNVIAAADTVMAPVFAKRLAADIESHLLAATRDALLPTLLGTEDAAREGSEEA